MKKNVLLTVILRKNKFFLKIILKTIALLQFFGANNNKKYTNYKAYKFIAIKNLIYNECDQKLLKKLNNMDLKEKESIESEESSK